MEGQGEGFLPTGLLDPFYVPKGTPHGEKNSDEKTLVKRNKGVNHVKGCEEYVRYAHLRQEGVVDVVPEPNPNDSSASKKKWERQMQQWRVKFKAI